MPDDFCRFETPMMKSVRSGFEKVESIFANAHSVVAIGPAKISLWLVNLTIP